MGSLWIYCKRFLRFLSDPDRLCCSPSWKSITETHILAGSRHVVRRVTEARSAVFYTVSRSCEPSVSWFAVYRMCNETVRRSKEAIFLEVFDGFWCSNDISSGLCGFKGFCYYGRHFELDVAWLVGSATLSEMPIDVAVEDRPSFALGAVPAEVLVEERLLGGISSTE